MQILAYLLFGLLYYLYALSLAWIIEAISDVEHWQAFDHALIILLWNLVFLRIRDRYDRETKGEPK